MDSTSDVIALVFVITLLAVCALVHYVRVRIGQLRERRPMGARGRRKAAYGSNSKSGKYSDSGNYSSSGYSGSDSSDSSGSCDSGSSSCD